MQDQQPRSPRNTSRAIRQDPREAELLLMLGMLNDGDAGPAILQQEADGQRELVHSDVIPAQVLHSTEQDLIDLGFKLGPKVDGDPLFRAATLPDGWKREASDHSMWSYIVDELGRRRCAMFYKAAFYDRKAHTSVTSVYDYVSECMYEDRDPLLDDTWATREAVLSAVAKLREYSAEQVEFWTTHDNAEYVSEHQDKIANCDALRERVEGAQAS